MILTAFMFVDKSDDPTMTRIRWNWKVQNLNSGRIQKFAEPRWIFTVVLRKATQRDGWKNGQPPNLLELAQIHFLFAITCCGGLKN